MERATLKVKVRPGARESRIKGFDKRGILLVDVAAAPEKGKANRELLKLLKKRLGVEEATILKGGSSREKLVSLRGAGCASRLARLDG